MKFEIGDIVAVVSKATMPWLRGRLGIVYKIYKGENGTVKYGVMIEGKNNRYSKDGAYWFCECDIKSVTHNKVACSAYPKINGYMDTDEAITKYILNDIDITNELYAQFTLNHKEWEKKCIMSKLNVATIKSVIFNDPATIVFWLDGTKTVVKAENEKYDPEKGLAMAIAKRALGNEGNYYNVFRKWLPKEEEEKTEKTKSASSVLCNSCRFRNYMFWARPCDSCDPRTGSMYKADETINVEEDDDDNIL